MEQWSAYYLSQLGRFERQNASLSGGGGERIVFVGDSLVQNFPLGRLLPGREWFNRGIAGDGVGAYRPEAPHRGLAARWGASVLAVRPQALFVLVGTNDMTLPGGGPQRTLRDLEELLAETKRRLPACRLCLHTLPPAGLARLDSGLFNTAAEDFNAGIAALAARLAAELIDLWVLFRGDDGLLQERFTGDGVHLTAEAYDVWAGEVARVLERWDSPAPDAPAGNRNLRA
ncbi:MAG: GDSL-type esterase/lipase family protein [Candidatus Sumerlaeia bacterium]|nr:GDSL-type esterase/lipase family protein [Candidatus Sumerlaeia bacterium]